MNSEEYVTSLLPNVLHGGVNLALMHINNVDIQRIEEYVRQ